MDQYALLSLKDVTKEYIQGSTIIKIVRNCSVDFIQGKTYAITGISGSGKSTIIHLLAGIDIPNAGVVILCPQKNAAVHTDDVIINQLQPHQRTELLSKHIGLVFQSPYLIKELNVVENCMLPGLIAGYAFDACIDRARMLLDQVGLKEKEESKPSALSGGQQQRLAIARALFNEPKFLLADEPTGNLDVHTGHVIIDLLLQCQQEHHMGIIISTHDEYVAERMQFRLKVEFEQLLLA